MRIREARLGDEAVMARVSVDSYRAAHRDQHSAGELDALHL